MSVVEGGEQAFQAGQEGLRDGVLAENQRSGYVGSLTPSQEDVLRKVWKCLLEGLEKMNGIDVNEEPGQEALGLLEGEGNSSSPQTVAKAVPVNGKLPKSTRIKKLFQTRKGQSSSPKVSGAKDSNNLISSELLKGMTGSELLWQHIFFEHPDSVVLRFVRARKWDVDKAVNMILKAIEWRSHSKIMQILVEGERGFNTRAMEKGLYYFHQTDNCGRPVVILHSRLHAKGDPPQPDLERMCIWTMETSRLMLSPQVETGTVVFDMSNFTLANMDYAIAKYMIDCLQSYYPESLGKVLIVEPPWVFHGVWKVIRPWLDPVVAAKVVLLRKKEELLNYIPAGNLPVYLGGLKDYEYAYVPPTEEDFEWVNGGGSGGSGEDNGNGEKEQSFESLRRALKEFIHCTKDWIDAQEDDGPAETSVPAADKRADLARQAREQAISRYTQAALSVDKYVRARTYYHRIGVLGSDGACNWN